MTTGKMERKKTIITAVLLITAIIALAATIRPAFTGYATLNTFENNHTVKGGSRGTKLSFEEIPSFRVKVGDRVSFKIRPNTNEKLVYSDNSQLFEIDDEGKIDFIAKSEGYHRIFVFITNQEREYYFQDFIVIIDE